MKRVIPMILISIFITSMFFMPSVFVNEQQAMTNFDGSTNSQALLSQLPHNARVAIYDEDNVTVPVISEAAPGTLTNNISEIATLLGNAGHSVDLLTEEDILDHQLITVNYDVFIIVNNVPRPSIFDLVREFSLGGGGLLTFENAVSYLWFGGFIQEGRDVDAGNSLFWGYYTSAGQNVTARHPTMKDYHEGDNVTLPNKIRVTHWGPALSSLRGSDMTLLTNNSITPGYITAFAIDNTRDGGRIVQLPGDGYNIPTDMVSIILDSVDWLVPRPKGRIAIDFAHQPRLGVDPWDAPYITVYHTLNNYDQFRRVATNHTYTFDKFYPSPSGDSWTAERLANYDVLVLCWPDVNYTASEKVTLLNWIAGGGSLLALGDRTGMTGPNRGDWAINFLLEDFDMQIGDSNILTYDSMTPGTHVTLEGCSSLYIGYRNLLEVTGEAVPIWFDGSDPVVAAQEFGQGRVILTSDINIFDSNQLGQDNNVRFTLNVLNWLTATDAEILLYTDWGLGGYYRDIPALALNDLGIPYQLVADDEYIDDHLAAKEWDYFIVNEVNYNLGTSVLDEIYNYVDQGGNLLMSYYNMDSSPAHSLWPALGVVDQNVTLSGSPTIYVWEPTHSIYNRPHDHSSITYQSGTIFGDDGDTVYYSEGFIPLAGNSPSIVNGSATTILNENRTTLFNTFLIDNFGGDEDDSTYADSVELWQNQIGFWYYDRPIINHPADSTYEEDTTGNTISWNPVADAGPENYVFRVNGVVTESGSWSGGSITIDVDGYAVDVYNCQLTVYDRLGYSVSDIVVLNVTAASSTTPTTTTSTGGGGTPLDPTLLLIIGVGAVVVIIIILVVVKGKGKK